MVLDETGQIPKASAVSGTVWFLALNIEVQLLGNIQPQHCKARLLPALQAASLALLLGSSSTCGWD